MTSRSKENKSEKCAQIVVEMVACHWPGILIVCEQKTQRAQEHGHALAYKSTLGWMRAAKRLA